MIAPEFANFFIASASASAALIGLLFVAVSLAPEQTVTRRAPLERQAVTGSAFTALMNAFFISLFALAPHFNLGTAIVPFSALCLLTSLTQTRHLLSLHQNWQGVLRGAFLVLLSLTLYGLELFDGFQFLTAPTNVGSGIGLVWCLIGAFAIGLVRAWELLGAQRYGLMGWLSPLRDLTGDESVSRTANSHAPGEYPPTDEGVPHSPV